MKHLRQEKDKYIQVVGKFQAQVYELSTSLQEIKDDKAKMEMESEAKDCMVEQLQEDIKNLNNEVLQFKSLHPDPNFPSPGNLSDFKLEGWLAIPNKQNIKKYGWKKQYVVVSSKKVFFYNSESDKQASTPSMILDIGKLFHVRSVTQGDVIRADAKDIPKIFQILYANEGVAKNPEEKEDQKQDEEKGLSIDYRGHQFIIMHYHMPTNCEHCPKPLWHMFKPPTAVECRRCHIKCHKDHVDREEDCITQCKVTVDLTTAKELLVLANTQDEQKQWVQNLGKKIVRKDPKLTGGSPRVNVTSQSSQSGVHRSQSSVNESSRPDKTPQRSVSVYSNARKD